MTWNQACQSLYNWFFNNVKDYGSSYMSCSVAGAGKVRIDCSGFVSGCLRVAGILKSGQDFCAQHYAQSNSQVGKILQQAGFTPLAYNLNSVQPFDIIAIYGGGKHHVEIYAGNKMAYGWGSYPPKRGKELLNPRYMAKYDYDIMWRLNGNGVQMGEPYVPPVQNSEQSYTGFSQTLTSSNYENISSSADNLVFADSMSNGLQINTFMNYDEMGDGAQRTRIYSALERTISVDELSMPMNFGTVKQTVAQEQESANA